ncbi:MAG: BMP family ABC transporter substrate-binding protein, partial [Allobranchiibius sp.]
NPNVHFAEVDNPSEAPNMYGMQFNTAQGAFLGGMLAAGMSKTGVVGTWGGAKIGPVTIYMDGFWEGVQYFNKTKSKSVKVLGWNETTKKGTFSNSFTDQGKGKSVTQQLASSGADVIFPVAGGSGVGAGAAAQAAGGKLRLMWVDTDGCESAATYCKYMVGSVTKNLSGGVQDYLAKSADGTYPKGNYIGDLKNNGVGLVDNNNSQSATLKAELTKIKAEIAAGTIKITSPSQPTS